MTTKLAKALAACERYPYGSGPTKAEMRLVLAAARRAEELVKAHSFCAECGPNVRVDEDGCCAGCGATATGSELPRFMGGCVRGEIRPRRPTKKGRR